MGRVKRIAHYLTGVLITLSVLVHWILPVVGVLLFLVYEFDEDWHLNDKAFKDILECAIGFFIAIAGILVWRFTRGQLG